MKKVLMLLAIAGVFTFASCGGKKEEKATDKKGETKKEEKKEEVKKEEKKEEVKMDTTASKKDTTVKKDAVKAADKEKK